LFYWKRGGRERPRKGKGDVEGSPWNGTLPGFFVALRDAEAGLLQNDKWEKSPFISSQCPFIRRLLASSLEAQGCLLYRGKNPSVSPFGQEKVRGQALCQRESDEF
jgi:hypothetical protein